MNYDNLKLKNVSVNLFQYSKLLVRLEVLGLSVLRISESKIFR